MYRDLSYFSGLKSVSFIFTLVLISFLTIGGCSENNSGGGGVDDPAPGPDVQMCQSALPPCDVLRNSNGTIVSIECGPLPGQNCALDLEVLKNTFNGNNMIITDDTVMWIEAWGAAGGTSVLSGSTTITAGAGGYAVTTTTINDIKAMNSGLTTLYYFYGSPGGNGGKHCGSSGGGSTIVTTEDLSMNPTSNPTQGAPPVLLVAGGGGGTPGTNTSGFCTIREGIVNGAAGGIAIATEDNDGQGAGGTTFNSTNPNTTYSEGGNQDGNGAGGKDGCIVCNGNNNQKAGTDGFGGLGGRGGSGNGCGGPQLRTFSNAPSGVFIDFTDGMGGNGSFNQGGGCNAGGGGGGGGYGGGGGGSQQNTEGNAVAGAGGGSFAIKSTKTSPLSPRAIQPNPCVTNTLNGCVRISFAP